MLRRVDVLREPLSLALTPDDAVLLVTNGAAHALVAFDARSLAPLWTRNVAAEPRGVAVAKDGTKALVTHATSSEVTVVSLDAHVEPKAAVDLKMPAGGATCSYVDPPRFARHAEALVRKESKNGRESFFVPVVQTAPAGASTSGYGVREPPQDPPLDTLNPRNRIEWGLGELDLQAITSDVPVQRERYEFEGHEFVHDCLLPREAIATPRGVLVACLGQSALIEIDRDSRGWPELIAKYTVPRGPSALAKVPGEPRALVWSPLAREIALVEFTTAPASRKARPALLTHAVSRTLARDERVIRGEELFHRTGDGQVSGGLACASCHPDGRDDGLVWSSPSGPLRTLVLAGNLEKSSFGWDGKATTLEARIARSIARLGGRGLDAAAIGDIAAYLRSLPKVPRGARSEAAARGAALFQSPRSGCSSCHTEATGFSDGQVHDVGSGGVFLTPSLLGAGARRALFHDGRYRDLGALLKGARGMGSAASLDDAERADLRAFLGSL